LLQIGLGFGVSALAIYYLLQQVSLSELVQAIGRAQPLPILLIVLFVLGSLVTRAARWQVLFLPDRVVPFSPLLGTLSISYMASTFLPLRAGELIRAVFLGQIENIPIPRVIGTIVLEKLFDFLAIGALLVVLVAISPVPDAARAAGISISSVILLGFGFVMALALWRPPTLRLVARCERLLPAWLTRRVHIERAVRQFAEGTDSLRVPALWVPLLGWTAITWACSIGSAWAGVLAMGLPVGLPAVLFLTVLTSTGQAVPSSPGYVGVYHAAATLALVAFGVDAASAIATAVIIHAFSYGTLVVAGLVALWTGGYSMGDLLTGLRGRPAALSSSVANAEPWPLAPDR
jgi:uncharacterized protein (TIRG00374 family)